MLDVKALLTKILGVIQQVTYKSPSSGWANIYADYTRAKRIGNVVTLKGYSAGGGFQLVANQYKAITTLPAQYRPDQTIMFAPVAMGGNAMLTGQVETNGIVSIYTTITTTYWAYSVTYLVD